MSDLDTYQWRLRAVGAFLDTQAAADASILEVRTGFALRYYRRREEDEPLFVLVEASQLQAITAALQERRAESTSLERTSQHPGQITEEDRYQDFFRALGWELDDLHASNVVMDEHGGEMYLSYSYHDPATSEWIRKRVASLGQAECESILADARSRRRM